MAVCDIAVVGGGLGGLALTAGLQRRGYNVKLYEAAAELRTGTSTLIGLGGNAFTSLEEMHPDIVPEIKRRGVKCQVSTSVHRQNKAAEKQVRKNPAFADLYTIRWSEVQNTIAQQVSPEVVHCSHRATGYTEEPGQDHVRVHFKGQPDVVAKFVVAADGVRSALRASMLPQDPGPRYLGHMNWNSLYHNVEKPGLGLVEPGEIAFWSNAQMFEDATLHAQMMDAGHGYTYWAVRIQSEEPQFTTPEGGGLGRPGAKARVAQLLEDAGFDGPLQLLQAIPESDIFERAMMDRVPLDELGSGMSSPGHRVVLLGDAAHAMHNGPGMGARTAFEDAHTLMLALEQQRLKVQSMPALFGTAALAVVLAQYEQQRLTRMCRLQRYAAEGCGRKSIRQHVHAPQLSYPEQIKRFGELNKWMSQYPINPDGDPESVYWKPLTTAGTKTASAV